MVESEKQVIAGRREEDTSPAVTPARVGKGRHEHSWTGASFTFSST